MDIHDESFPESAIHKAAPAASNTDAPVPWQMIEPGRYQPRRIKGSCVGRELG